jgi:hypothetical protein
VSKRPGDYSTTGDTEYDQHHAEKGDTDTTAHGAAVQGDRFFTTRVERTYGSVSALEATIV